MNTTTSTAPAGLDRHFISDVVEVVETIVDADSYDLADGPDWADFQTGPVLVRVLAGPAVVIEVRDAAAGLTSPLTGLVTLTGAGCTVTTVAVVVGQLLSEAGA